MTDKRLNEMADDERQELLNALYGEDNDTPKKNLNLDPSGFSRTRTIHVGAIKYEMPTPEYVLRLEQMVTQQARVIEMLKHDIAKLERFVVSTKRNIRTQNGRMSEMQQELNHKVDLRE